MLSLVSVPASAHTVYLAPDNHTDYGWNASIDAYESAMLAELDFYLGRIAATAGEPPEEQARYNADCWYYLWLYEQHRSPAQFQSLIDAIASGHITVPLNPFVTLYGALPTEAAIRAGYYPGRIERRYPIRFTLAQDIENQTNPWGIAGLWAGSGVEYSWKGICGCLSSAPFGVQRPGLFRWQGPDGSDLLMKWYDFVDNRSWGGYAEARLNVAPTAIQSAVEHFSALGQSATGLFGYGWDDVELRTDDVIVAVRGWNDTHPDGPRAVVSNIVDYFADVAQQRADLPVLRGGWGNDWDLWPATLATRTARLRRAVERLRGAEALAAAVYADGNAALWNTRQDALASAWLDYFKYFEHTWTDGGVGLSYVLANKAAWEEHFVHTVEAFDADASAAFAAGFATPDEDRFVVFNPLAFPRTDYADLPIGGAGPYAVSDVASGAAVPSQVIERDGDRVLRVLVRDAPSLGYRVYRYATAGSPSSDCCTVSPALRQIENDRYRVTAGAQGELISVIDKQTGDQELAAAAGLNAAGVGGVSSAQAESVGPVSATLRLEIGGAPPRRVRVTLVREVDRIEIEDETLAATADPLSYRFAVNLNEPDIHFEEVGAVARPGMVWQGGDFLPGTRADYMTLNHFIDLADALGGYHVTLSSRDAFAVRIGNSSASAFDLPTSQVSVLALGNVSQGGFLDQDGDTYFRHDFALAGASGGFSAAAATRMGMAHQNPLRAIPLSRHQTGPRLQSVAAFLTVDAPNVVVTAFKPAEDGGRGLLVRLWELDGADTEVTIDAAALHPSAAVETSLIETDRAPRSLDAGRLHEPIRANQMKAFRFDVGPLPPTATSAPSATPTPSPQATNTSSRSPTASATATRSATVTARSTSTGTATRTVTPLLTPLPGDLDGDHRITRQDLGPLIAALFEADPPGVADVNGDHHVSAADLPALLQLL